MFTKKFLSLLLAVGLAFGLSSGVFALKDSTVNVAESNTEIVKEFATMLTVPAAAKFFVNYVYRTVVVTAVICEFCNALKECSTLKERSEDKTTSCMDNICHDILVMELSTKFEYLYNNNKKFKKAFDNAWIKKSNGEKSHATHGGTHKHFRRATGGRGWSDF